MAHGRSIFIACYAASGAAALVYQVAWVRLFTLALGHTVAASSTVLAAFMGGLAIGAVAAGRQHLTRPRLLLAYAALEIFIAAAAIVLPLGIAATDPILAWSYADGEAPVRFAAVRVALCLVLLGIPAAAMGATFPIAVSWLTAATHDGRSMPAASAGLLYAANTAGAAAGAIAAGFWLIPTFGIRGTTWVGVALNVLAAGGAWILFRSPPAAPGIATVPTPGKRPRARPQTPPPPTDTPHPDLAAGAAALSGFAALVYEVAWTRLIALIVGPTTYAFAIMAASFITGIAIGSSVGVRLVRRGSTAALWLGAMLVVTAAGTMAGAWFTASHLPLIVARETAAATTFAPILIGEALALTLVLLPASISLGATFTLALAAAAPGVETAGRDTARVYAANTVGAVAGALAAGFVLIPRFGLQPTFLATSQLLVAAGIAVAAMTLARPGKRRAARRRPLLIAAGCAAMIATFVIPEWDRDLITSGAYKYARQMPQGDLEWTLRAGQLEFYEEGAAGTVSVRSLAGARSLAIDGKVDASNAGDMLTQRLLGLLPTLLRPDARDALVIGLGSGVTADAVLATGEVQNLDVVEISPEVVAASALFERENRGVLNTPGVRLLVGDGRSHLRLTSRQYDVIVSEPSNPWMAGVAALFTYEFFEAARARLRPGGVFCQWAHTYEIAETDLRSIVNTFTSVFPDGTMWLVGESDLLLVGFVDADIESRIAGIAARTQLGDVPALVADVAVPPGAAPFVLLSMFAGGPGELAAFGGDAVLQTDDRMALEFTAARAMYAPPEGTDILRALAGRARVPAVIAESIAGAGAAEWTARGQAALKARAFGMAHESFRRALALDPGSPDALRGATEAAAGERRLAEHASLLETLAASEPGNAAVRVERSHALSILGDVEGAVAAARDAARLAPSSPEPLEQLASVLADAGDAAGLVPIASDLVRRFPAREEGHYYQAAAMFLAGRVDDAERAIRAFAKAYPRHAKGQNLLGAVCASRGDEECALAAFAAALEVNPRDPSVYVNLGYLRVERGDAAGAAGYFSEALAIDAASEAARRGLAELGGP